jgi:NAD(P)H-hydrate epimerase
MTAHKLNASQVRRLIPPRPADSHKGKNGHVLVAAGSSTMTGAAYLCALGALRAGAGLVTVAAPAAVRSVIARRLPEAMTQAVRDIGEYVRRRTITTLAVGPGLGVGASQKALVLDLIRKKLPMVLDADALNNLSAGKKHPSPLPSPFKGEGKRSLGEGWSHPIITPHPGELARLLGKSTREIQKDRTKIAAETSRMLKVICVLKGHQTIISDGARTFVNTTGNQAMATGGMGDVLTGVIAGFLAQGLSPIDAACAGVYLHGLAGDLARVSDRGLLASEVAAQIPHALKKIGIR